MECVFKAREQLESIWKSVELCHIASTPHKKFISSMFFVALNHCDGIQTLVQQKNFASSFALIRPLLETSFRAIWLHRCANEQQIQKCIKDDQWKSAWQLAQEIESHTKNVPILSKAWQEMLPLMHSYTHGGVQNAFRQLGDENWITPNVHDLEVLHLMRLVGLISWLILAEFIDLSNDSTQLKQLEKLGEDLHVWGFKHS